MAQKQLDNKKTAKNNFDLFIKKILAKAATISIMGLVRDDGTTVRLYDQFSLNTKELEHRLITALKMSRLFPPSARKNSPDHLIQANEAVISLNTLTNGWHLVVIGNKNSVPGPFPSLCAEYRQKLIKPKANITTSSGQAKATSPAPATSNSKVSQPSHHKSSNRDEPQIIGDPNDFFVNPFTEQDDSQADVYLVLESDNDCALQPSSPSTKALNNTSQDNTATIIGDPDLFFANPFGSRTSQLAMATGQEQHHALPAQLARKSYGKNL